MNQLSYNSNINWDLVGPILLTVVIFIMIVLFKKDRAYMEQAIKGGAALFLVAITLNIIGLTVISDSFTVFAFVIIAIASIRLFWSETKER